jgi:hypothetical protein
VRPYIRATFRVNGHQHGQIFQRIGALSTFHTKWNIRTSTWHPHKPVINLKKQGARLLAKGFLIRLGLAGTTQQYAYIAAEKS